MIYLQGAFTEACNLIYGTINQSDDLLLWENIFDIPVNSSDTQIVDDPDDTLFMIPSKATKFGKKTKKKAGLFVLYIMHNGLPIIEIGYTNAKKISDLINQKQTGNGPITHLFYFPFTNNKGNHRDYILYQLLYILHVKLFYMNIIGTLGSTTQLERIHMPYLHKLLEPYFNISIERKRLCNYYEGNDMLPIYVLLAYIFSLPPSDALPHLTNDNDGSSLKWSSGIVYICIYIIYQ